MKKFTLLLAMASVAISSQAQTESSMVVTDTTVKKATGDTIRIGNIVIIKKTKTDNNGTVIESGDNSTTIKWGRNKKKKEKITTNWGILDIGFANYIDETNYNNTGNYLVNRPGSQPFSEGDFKLRSGKSINVNIWFFMQRLSLIKNNVNLKYGLGLELNNYRYKSAISYKENGTIPYSNGLQTSNAFVFRDSITFNKNKLAADYLTVPLMLNFASHPGNSKKGISASIGVSAGYLYSQRNKQKSADRKKETQAARTSCHCAAGCNLTLNVCQEFPIQRGLVPGNCA